MKTCGINVCRKCGSSKSKSKRRSFYSLAANNQKDSCDAVMRTMEEESNKEPSVSSYYMKLLSSLASDLDFMLTDLCPSPPPLSTNPLTQLRGDAFLEPYMEGLGREDSITKTGVRSLTNSPVQDNRKISSHFIIDLKQEQKKQSIDQVDGVCKEQDSGEESSRESSGSVCEEETPCGIGLMERLIRSHPVWFLPDIQRAGAFHLLQGKEEGNFVVRQSSQSSTMAISVRLPVGKGPYIEHYLIQAGPDNQLSLESSENKFPNIPDLIAHYAQCCDELPVQLTLPRAIRDAKNRQQLSSLALLGQEFWGYPMANPRPIQITPEPQTQQVSESTTGLNSSLPSSQASSLSSFGSGNNNNPGRSPTGEMDPIVLNLTPLNDQAQLNSLLSTFKGSPPNESVGSPNSNSCESPVAHASLPSLRAPRPTPPNTLNLISTSANNNSNCKSVSSPPTSLGVVPTKTPPPPPPRWSKPAPNFTVTTTVTFSMRETSTSSPPLPLDNSSKQASLCDSESLPSLASGTATLESNKTSNIKSPVSDPLPGNVFSPTGSETKSSLMSPISDSKPAHRRSKRHKESRHYQESDILESPTVYYRSSVADKVSDYEDIWGPESMTTFKPRSSPFMSPDEGVRKVPDILDRIPPCPAPRPSLNAAPSTPHPSPITPSEPQTPTETAPSNNKQSSPFYCEPADAIKTAALEVARRRNRNVHRSNRHSDPATLLQWPSNAPPGILERIDSKEELSLTGLSSSVDNLVGPRRLGRRIGILERGKGKPKISKRFQGKSLPENSWAVDSSWEFIGNEEDPGSEQEDITSPEEGLDRKFPSLEQQDNESPCAKGISIQELIAERCPELRLQTELLAMRNDPAKSDSSGNSGSRVSAYDNVTNQQNGASTQSHISDDDTQTIFSEPWDSSRWETLLERGDDWQRGEERVNIVRTKSFKERLDPFLCAPRLAALKRTRECGGTGTLIRSYTLQLAGDNTTVFAQTIDNFISCTRESKETRPQVVMRNMRQFMTGMKNYLVTHGEREFELQVEKERNKLRANEFLNLDAILEGVMHKLVVRPLREHLYRLFVDEYSEKSAIQLLAENIKYARTKLPKDIGIKPHIILPSEKDMEEICSYLQKVQEVDSPLEKLENLLSAIASIYSTVKVSNGSSKSGNFVLGADDFLPLFVWVLVQSGMVAAEIEADYMWGLLHPSLLSGEGGYYLTTLSSAVHVLKSFRASSEEYTASGSSLNWGPGPLAEFRSVLKIVVPDEMNGSIITKTLPIRPNMTTKDVCKIIAHKVRITNPQDYGLYKLIDGEETLLADGECPQDIKGSLSSSGQHCMFAYKRIDAKIAWPKSTSH
ncbi:protein sprint isoform X2 [Cimex lectularius]|uniref:Protein sprint n=1 Tax=Cimex lectularius TaxID=79782 RepID=A0A8I6RKX8_CIMLE|nr:protein sprint isoform X2 [Cimex lectularius]